MSDGYAPDLPALTEEERYEIQQGNGPTRLRQVLAHQHPVHEALGKAFDNLGGVTNLTRWAEQNQTEFYKLFAKTAPQPKEQTFIAINGQLNPPEHETFDTERLDNMDANGVTAAYAVIVRGGDPR